MAKGIKKNIRLYYLLLLVLALVLILLVIINSNNAHYFNGVNNYSQSERYISKFMHIEFIVPSGFSIEDKLIDISLKKNDEAINMSRIGTNFESPREHLKNLSIRNKLRIIEEKDLTINGMQAVRAIIKSPLSGSPDELSYFIYNDYAIYSFSTSSPELYGDLDEIAKSFRYTP